MTVLGSSDSLAFCSISLEFLGSRMMKMRTSWQGDTLFLVCGSSSFFRLPSKFCVFALVI